MWSPKSVTCVTIDRNAFGSEVVRWHAISNGRNGVATQGYLKSNAWKVLTIVPLCLGSSPKK